MRRSLSRARASAAGLQLFDGRWPDLADGGDVDGDRQALARANGRRFMTELVTAAISDALQDERLRQREPLPGDGAA